MSGEQFNKERFERQARERLFMDAKDEDSELFDGGFGNGICDVTGRRPYTHKRITWFAGTWPRRSETLLVCADSQPTTIADRMPPPPVF